MSVSTVSNAIATAAGLIPCTADFQRFVDVKTLKHPDVRLYVAEKFAAGAHLIFLAARDGILLIRKDGRHWGYEEACKHLQSAAPVIGYAIMELCDHHVRGGHAYGAAVWAAGLLFGVED